jgi:hypothetical protein
MVRQITQRSNRGGQRLGIDIPRGGHLQARPGEQARAKVRESGAIRARRYRERVREGMRSEAGAQSAVLPPIAARGGTELEGLHPSFVCDPRGGRQRRTQRPGQGGQ